MTSFGYERTMGSRPSSSWFIMPKAGIMPTRPAARGMVPVATAVVWSTTFSAVVKGWKAGKRRGKRGPSLNIKKPIKADWSDIMDTQPVV